ncbi:MAG: hypothetical protein HOM97_03345 [Nitrospina sp.]|nr:hypothetical protein [Nitrospina sp.]MBT6345722.1 hypothetical protein [Nitrospina sp.]
MFRNIKLISLFTAILFLFGLTGNMLISDPDFSSIAFAKKKDKDKDKDKDKKRGKSKGKGKGKKKGHNK